jgi:hypothetical protein
MCRNCYTLDDMGSWSWIISRYGFVRMQSIFEDILPALTYRDWVEPRRITAGITGNHIGNRSGFLPITTAKRCYQNIPVHITVWAVRFAGSSSTERVPRGLGMKCWTVVWRIHGSALSRDWLWVPTSAHEELRRLRLNERDHSVHHSAHNR